PFLPFSVIKFRGLYIDAYYTINRTESSGTCDEFKHTLPKNVTSKFLCRKAGEEMSRRDANRTVVKLELYFERTQKTSDDKLTLHSTYASKLRKSYEKCLYPVQIRPGTSFYGKPFNNILLSISIRP
ncbi:unnamed protein product, partial [Dicrocoelium dendriticum]